MATVSLVQEINSHLKEVTDNLSRSLDKRLLEKVDTQVSEAFSEEDRIILINQLSNLLLTIQQDPTPVTILTEILIRPLSFTFSHVLSIQPPVNFAAGLSVPSEPINLLTLNLLNKASGSASDVGIIAGKPDVIIAFVRLWLCTQDTAVAQKALSVLTGLLIVDYGLPLSDEDLEMTGGPFVHSLEQRLMWRRLLNDKDVYGQIFSLCSLKTLGREGQLNKREKTIAQARLLDFLKVFADVEMLQVSQIREIEEQYGVEGGLLEFAAVHMVDFKDDVLIHMTLIDFFAAYLSADRGEVNIPDSMILSQIVAPSERRLNFLISKNFHSRILSYYIEPAMHDSLDLTYLYGRSANYISVYATDFSDHLLQSSTADGILWRLSNVLKNVSSHHWSHDVVPHHDLLVLTSLPRVLLLPATSLGPMFLVPIKPPCAAAYGSLGTIFSGPKEHAGISKVTEQAAARALYFLYVERHPEFWAQLVKAAETVALKDTALAAIKLMGDIICAKWSLLPSIEPNESNSQYSLPTERQLAAECHFSGDLPSSGVYTIMASPALDVILPYLLRPAQKFSGVMSGRGDPENAPYKVAVAKYEVLNLLHRKLSEVRMAAEESQLSHWYDIIRTLEQRISQGPMGESSEAGSRIGTLEL